MARTRQPPPAKKRRKSASSRSKASSLSVEYLRRKVSGESSEEDECLLTRKRNIKQKRKEPGTQLSSLWQNPNYATELGVTGLESDECQTTASGSASQSLIFKAINANDGIRPNFGDVAGSVAPKHASRTPKIFARKRFHKPPPVDTALVAVHNQLVNLESRFQKDLHQLENSYIINYYTPLLKLRCKLLEAAKALNSIEPKDGDPKHERKNASKPTRQTPKKVAVDCLPGTSFGMAQNDQHLPSCDLFKNCAEVILKGELGKENWSQLSRMLTRISEAMNQSSRCNICAPNPHRFWYYVFQRSDPMVSEMLSIDDAEVLGYLRDVRVTLVNVPWPDSPEFKSNIGVIRRHPPFLKSKPVPGVSTRHSVSLPSQSSKSADSEAAGESAAINPSSRPMHCNSETSTVSFKDPTTCAKINTVIGFELEFEFYPNPHIKNSVLRKRYLIDVKPQDEDYVEVKRYKTFLNPQDAHSKAELFTSDGGDEWSTDSEMDEPEPKRKKRSRTFGSSRKRNKKHRYHRLLDYRGPRLIAIEGSTVRWKGQRAKRREDGKVLRHRRHWMTTSDISVKTSSSGESEVEPKSFFDFFGWNWDIFRNRIMTNDGFQQIELENCEVRAYVERDFEIGSYIRDVVIPRAFAIYRSNKPTHLKVKTSSAESILDSVSERISVENHPNQLHQANPVYTIPSAPLPPPPPSNVELLEQPTTRETLPELNAVSRSSLPQQNLARSYDDVDEIAEIPSKMDQPDLEMEQNMADDQTDAIDNGGAGPSGSLETSRKKVSDLVKNVNTIIHQANTHNAFHQPLVPSEPLPGDPLTCPIDTQLIPEVRQTVVLYQRPFPPEDSDIQSSGAVSHRGGEADDENNWTDRDPPSVNRAFEKIRGQFRRGKWKKTKPKIISKPPVIRNNDQQDDEIVSSICEKEKRVNYRPNSPCPSDEDCKIDESDLLSSSGASDAAQRESGTPSTSDYDASNPDLCPCDLHLLGEDEKKKGRRWNKEDTRHLLCSESFQDMPRCSMGRDIMKDDALRKEHLAKEKMNKKEDFIEVDSSDSEAPPIPDHKSCKQQ